VLEDLHWAEPRLLDLVEYLVDSAVDAPILFLCLTRPELAEDRPTWAGGKPNASTIRLEPLAEHEADELLTTLAHEAGLPAQARARAAQVAEGNPLFLEQAVSMLAEGGPATGDLQLPPTIEALLTMRLERLEPGERIVLECAAVVGKEFTPDLLLELLPDEERSALDRRLEALVRKQFVRPEPADGGEGAFQFRHVLVQNASYRSLTKDLRASLHELVAGRLEKQAAGRLAEVEEIVGYHLEQAFRARAALGLVDEEAPALARKASERLASAGDRAHRRGDAAAAVNLLERAASLLPDDDPARLELLTDLSRALYDAGDFQRADAVLAEPIERASAAGDQRIEWNAILLRSFLQTFTAPESMDLEALAQEAKRAISLFEELGDHLGLARAWQVVMSVEWTLGRMTAAHEAAKQGAEHARQAGGGTRRFGVSSTPSGRHLTGSRPPRRGCEAARMSSAKRRATGGSSRSLSSSSPRTKPSSAGSPTRAPTSGRRRPSSESSG